MDNPIIGPFGSLNTIDLIIPIFFDYIPFKLINPPGESYNQVLKLCLNSIEIFTHCPSAERIPFPQEIEEIEELDTVDKQKYYVVGFVVDFYKKHKGEFLEFNDGCLLMSLLPWKIDLDCQDARNLENSLMQLCNTSNKNYDYDREKGKYFARYLITKVLPATQPLNPEELKNKMSQLSQTAENRGTVDSGNDLFGCCSIQ